jgi:ABC-2 type transport system permease protein
MSATTAGGRAQPASQRREEFQRNVNLARELAWTQFKLKYTGSVLGYLWSLVKPLILFSIMYTIFVVLFHQRAHEFALQLLVGIVVFTFFTDCVGAGMSSIAANGNLIRKAFFPRSILVIASSLTAAMTFVINMTLIVVIATPLGHLSLGLRSMAVVPLVLELYVLALGLSLLLASLFVFYRDLGHIWEIFSQVLFYGSAVVYPATLVPARWTGIFFINPMAQIIEDVRHALVIPDAPWTSTYVGAKIAIPIFLTVTLLAGGLVVFRRLTPVFAENL